MIKENNFITKVIPSNVDFWRYKENVVNHNYDIEGEAQVEWEFYVEYRSWGIKNISVYATNVEIDYTITRWMDEGDDKVEEYSLNSDDDKWELESNSDEIEFGHCIEPQNVEVDFEHKVITITF